MRKVLEINSKPRIRTYNYHAYVHAIISNSKNVNEDVAIIKVKDFSTYSWQIQNDKLTYNNLENDILCFKSNKWNTGMNICFWRRCEIDDEIEMCIQEQLYSNIWGSINLFIRDEEQSNMLCDDDYTFRYGNFNGKGLYLKIDGVFKNLKKVNSSNPICIKIKKKQDEINTYVKDVNGDYVLTNQYKNSRYSKDGNVIGFEVKLGNNAYFNWLFTNYIQIKGDINSTILCMDYVVDQEKNWKTYTSNAFIDFNTETRESINQYGLSMIHYIKNSISMGRYIGVDINKNVIKGKINDKVFFHYSLIYGFCDEDEDGDEGYFMLLYYKDGFLQTDTITYSQFNLPQNRSSFHDIVVIYKYNPDERMLVFDKKVVKNELIKFCNPKLDFPIQKYLLEKDCYVGIEYIKQLCTEDGINALLRDSRIIYLLNERMNCMKDRVEYLLFLDMLKECEYKEILTYIEHSLHILFVLQNMVLLFHSRNRVNRDKMSRLVKEMYECEEKYINKLISFLD